MHNVTVEYLFNGELRTHTFELEYSELSGDEAAMHLLQLHFGDGENSLIMPSADATPEEILEQAELMGLTQIQVVDHPV
ncbi:hypothetical protein ACOI9X_22200 [Pseudomonas sp. P2757]|uniref:hypothetical protein n=1 Tax=unclassified Pseudomonas TaxID=196821 RepID=UPI003B59FC7A